MQQIPSADKDAEQRELSNAAGKSHTGRIWIAGNHPKLRTEARNRGTDSPSESPKVTNLANPLIWDFQLPEL